MFLKKRFFSSFRKPRVWILLYWIAFGILFIPLILLNHLLFCFCLFIFSGVLFFIPTLIPNDSLFGPIVTDFSTNHKEVWLTIDDGPDPHDTPQILDLLDQYEAKATFFVIGKKAQQYPHLLQEIFQRGHSIGNHTHTHPVASFWIAFPQRLRKELQSAQTALTQISGGPAPKFFRAPVGMINFFLHPILQEQALTLVGWSTRGFDTVGNNPHKIVNRIWKNLRPGGIILLHEGIHPKKNTSNNCPQVLKRLLQKLSAEHYKCVIPLKSHLT